MPTVRIDNASARSHRVKEREVGLAAASEAAGEDDEELASRSCRSSASPRIMPFMTRRSKLKLANLLQSRWRMLLQY